MEKLEKSLFIGREEELDEIIDDVKSNKGTRLLLVGESGIGRLLLDKIYRILGRRRRDRLTD